MLGKTYRSQDFRKVLDASVVLVKIEPMRVKIRAVPAEMYSNPCRE